VAFSQYINKECGLLANICLNVKCVPRSFSGGVQKILLTN
jgi:hypothetical protein